MALNHKRPRRRRRGPNNKTGMILISAVLVLVFLVTFARVLTLKKTQAVYSEKEEYYGETRTLDNHIKRIRQKLGYEDVIKTVFGIGYRMEVPEA